MKIRENLFVTKVFGLTAPEVPPMWFSTTLARESRTCRGLSQSMTDSLSLMATLISDSKEERMHYIAVGKKTGIYTGECFN